MMYLVRNEVTGIIIMETRFLWRAKRRIRQAKLKMMDGQVIYLGSMLAIYTTEA